ncbi:hypothetical protein T265_06842 [Opisthorchis viverrini]|uniref:Uncharacterized protein n=1 Tax=Opisthorchis viverrini TaxID=6198 RepID=A0A075ACZ6_OPIVI|nr:hypothetical protein T265_06842 [Opisthorchis viverrini]KER25739.1 hypothetical protein T265_06842 [Opisthorchis viverrini]
MFDSPTAALSNRTAKPWRTKLSLADALFTVEVFSIEAELKLSSLNIVLQSRDLERLISSKRGGWKHRGRGQGPMSGYFCIATSLKEANKCRLKLQPNANYPSKLDV